jgi:uncharacterized sulfatase
MQRSQITGGFVKAAVGFIDQAQQRKRPFYINLWPDDVHSPFFPPLEKWGDDKRALYYAVLDAMDEQLAPLIDRVRQDESLQTNTLIMLCSDNGHEQGAGSSKPLRGAKTWLYEGGVRSPLIVWGPGLLAENSAGTTNDESIFCALDVNRSLYELCGVGVADNVVLDGENLADTLLGKARQNRKAPIFWRRPPDRPGFGHGLDEDNPDLAVRHGPWKYFVNYDGSDPQLYDLDADISETMNVVDSHPEIARRLHKELTEWNAAMPADAGDSSRFEKKKVRIPIE